MPLFDDLDVSTLSLDGLDYMIDTIGQCTTREEMRGHWADYQDLLDRLIEQRYLLRSAQLQEEQKRITESKQSAHASYKAAQKSFRERVTRANKYLDGKSIEPNRVTSNEKANLGDMLLVVDSAWTEREKFTARTRKQGAGKRAESAYRSAETSAEKFFLIVQQRVNSEIEQEKAAFELTLELTVPPVFHNDGWRKLLGASWKYPSGGYISASAKTYLIHPNRACIHFKDELQATASKATAQAYLDSFVRACLAFLASDDFKRGTPDTQIRFRYDDTTLRGTAFFWSLIGQRYKADKLGHAGEINHADSGYARSRWLNG